MRRHFGYDYGYFPPSQPRAARGGIKAQSGRGSFGESWWAKRWIGVLESFDLGSRLTRGRSYARSGQVLNIDIEAGAVHAEVQGSRPTPYSVTIEVKQLSPAEWKKVGNALSSQALFAAKLLAGEMPNEIEEVFREAGVSLLPDSLKDLGTDCSCPDYSNPCKHIAAVYYLLGEEFDRDPFLIFKMRGVNREDLVGRLGETAPEGASAATESALPPEPLISDITSFWNGAIPANDPFGEVRIPTMTAALLRQLGSFPFWRGDTPLQDALDPLYEEASRRGMDVFLGEGDRTADRIK